MFLISLRTISTCIPRISMRRFLVLTLILHDLEDAIHQTRIRTEYRLDGVADLALLELVAAPVRLLYLADSAIHRQRLRLSGIGGWSGAVRRRSLPYGQHPGILQVVIERAQCGAVDARGMGRLGLRMADLFGKRDDLCQVGLVVH